MTEVSGKNRVGCQMDERQQLKIESDQWHSDHLRWLADADSWTHHTHRLIAILHKLERSLPEHTARLDQHVELIRQHEDEIRRYECGLDPQCMPGCDSFIAIEKQREFHDRLRKLHLKMQQQHRLFSEQYQQQMALFYEQAKNLMQEIAED